MKFIIPEIISLEMFNEIVTKITNKKETDYLKKCFIAEKECEGKVTHYKFDHHKTSCRKVHRILMHNGYFNKRIIIDSENREQTISFISTLLQKAEDKISHFDLLRQKYINYALIIFAAPFTLLSLSKDITSKIGYVFAAISLIMFIFCLLDNRLHRLSHGWQTSRRIFTENIIELLDNRTNMISFPLYNVKGESTAELFSFQPIIYYTLVISSTLCSIFSFCLKFF